MAEKGIKESTELVKGLSVGVGLAVDKLADGFQPTDVTLVGELLGNPDVRAALDGITKIREELGPGQVKPSEIARLIEEAARDAAVELEARGK